MGEIYRSCLDYSEMKYHNVDNRHPVRYVFLKMEVTKKEADRIKEYFENKFKIMIRTKREKGVTYFMSSQFKQKDLVQYCFDNYEFIRNEFKFKSIYLDLSIIQ